MCAAFRFGLFELMLFRGSSASGLAPRGIPVSLPGFAFLVSRIPALVALTGPSLSYFRDLEPWTPAGSCGFRHADEGPAGGAR
jgi:hypothetical protein